MTPSFRALSWLNAFWKQSMRFMHNHQLYWQIIYGASSPKSLGRLHSYKGYRWAHHTHTHTHTQSQCQTYLSQISYLCSPVTKIVYFPPKWCPFQILFAQMGNGYYRLWPNTHTHLETLKTENRAKVLKKIISIRRIEPQCNSSTMQEPIHFSLHNWS